MVRATPEKFKTLHNVFDEFVNRTLYKLITEGHFEGLIGPVCIGKESNIFQARKKDGSKVIVKIYRLETCDFNRMYDYIKTDPRFAGLQRHRRKVIFAWCQREYRNLFKARAAGVRVPTPYAFKNNVLVMEFIGTEQPAPKLKDCAPAEKQAFFDSLLEDYRKLYQDASLVHSDFSQFNILNLHEQPVIIDFSTATPVDDPHAEAYLQRDARNIVNFFKKSGLSCSTEEAIKRIKKKR